MRSILLFADRSPAMPARLETALSLARMTNGHVSVLVDTPVTRYVSMDPMGGGYVASEALHQALAADDSHAQAIEERLSAGDVPFDIMRSEAEPVDAIAAAAKLADIVVISRVSDLAGDIVLTCGTPVLVVGEDSPTAFPVSRACVAWDGGNEAAAALRGAAPILSLCESVDVVTVAEKPRGFPPTEAVRYLSRHGVQAQLHEVPRAGSTEECLASTVSKLGAQVLVMGAYGKSRMREYLFGGVTRYLLEMASGPALFMAH